MTPTEKGAFCQKCAMEVHDVSSMTNLQIRALFSENKGKRTCVRMTLAQEESMNDDFNRWNLSNKKNMQRAMVFSLLVVFGLTLFSCNNPQQVQELQQLRSFATSLITATENPKPTSVEEVTTGNRVEKAIETTEKAQENVVETHVRSNKNNCTLIDEVTVDISKRTDVTTFDAGISYTAGEPMMSKEYIDFIEVEIPEETRLSTDNSNRITEFTALAFPNPVITNTRIEVKLPEKTEKLQLVLMDLNGRILEEISNGAADSGIHNFEVSMQDLKPAYYLIDVRYNDKHEIVRISKVQ